MYNYKTKRKIIILNAPPGAGKDTIGKLIHEAHPESMLKSMKESMFEIALAILGPGMYRKFLEAYNDRKQKEKPQAFLNGKSPREFMIWISEDVVKPQFGDQHFGHRFVESALNAGASIICTDGGFPDEIKPLIKSGFYVDVFRLHREGYTFQGDSRNYLRLGNWHHRYREFDLTIYDGEPELAAASVINLSGLWYWEGIANK